jgi:cytochrome c nitrite reductase small subunit
MGAHFAAWRASSHHAVAGCNDCHAPPGGLRKYWVKARNGLHHSYAFTTGDFVDPLRITADNRAVTEEQCRHCHGDLARTMGAVGGSVGAAHADAAPGVACTRCHATVGHWVRV